MQTQVTEPSPGFKLVAKDEFFARIGSRDVSPRCAAPDYTLWETRNRVVVGKTLPGWRFPGHAKAYMLPGKA